MLLVAVGQNLRRALMQRMKHNESLDLLYEKYKNKCVYLERRINGLTRTTSTPIAFVLNNW
jgi:hypothetical protein